MSKTKITAISLAICFAAQSIVSAQTYFNPKVSDQGDRVDFLERGFKGMGAVVRGHANQIEGLQREKSGAGSTRPSDERTAVILTKIEKYLADHDQRLGQVEVEVGSLRSELLEEIKKAPNGLTDAQIKEIVAKVVAELSAPSANSTTPKAREPEKAPQKPIRKVVYVNKIVWNRHEVCSNAVLIDREVRAPTLDGGEVIGDLYRCNHNSYLVMYR